MATLRSALIFVSVGLLAACGGSDSTPPVIAGPPAALTKTGDNQTADPGATVTVAPSVKVVDAAGIPVPGATVIFSIGDGAGTITGATQTTNAAGVATVGSWKLGAGPGATNTLLVSVEDLDDTFTATATGTDPCTLASVYTFGTTATGTLSTADCLADNAFYTDFFQTSVTPTGAYLFGQSSTVVDPYLILFAPNGFAIGWNDDDFYTASTDSRLKALVPAGTYFVAASSAFTKEVGAYSITSSATSASIDNCEDVFIARGMSVPQALTTTDCLNSGFYSDDISIFLVAGQSVTITMTSPTFDTYLELYAFTNTSTGVTLAAFNDNKDATTTDAQLTFSAPTTDFYLIAPTTKASGVLGAYTLAVQ
jgi:hypothetical protein